LAIGDRAPLHTELAHLDFASRVFIVPPKFVVLHIQGRIVFLGIVMAKLDGSGAEGDSSAGRDRTSIPDLGE
jgi:hypothetical protein